MALIRQPNIDPIRRSSRFDSFAAPNLLLSTFLAFIPFGPQQAETSNNPPAQRPTIQEAAPSNLLLTTLAVAAEPQFTPRAPILQDYPRRTRSFENQIYQRTAGPPGGAPPVGDPFFQKIDYDSERRKGRARVVNYSLNLSLGQDSFFYGLGRGPFNYDFTIPRRARPNPTSHPDQRFQGLVEAPVVGTETLRAPIMQAPARGFRQAVGKDLLPNLLSSTLSGPQLPPFEPWKSEHQAATRQRQPLPVEPVSLNMSLRGAGIMPFDSRLWEFKEATRRRQPLQVESYGLNASRIIPEVPKVHRFDEKQQVGARRSQDFNTFLHPLPFQLIGKDARIFTYDFTVTRGFRPNPQEPVFRNFLTSQPVATPFQNWRFAYDPPSRRRGIGDRPTLDINRLLPLQSAIKPIGAQYFEASPHARQTVARYTFLHPLQFWLIGNDLFFYGPGRGPFNYDFKIQFRRISIERESINDLGAIPLVSLNFAPDIPGIEYTTNLELLQYRSKVDRLHYASLKDWIHYRIQEEDS